MPTHLDNEDVLVAEARAGNAESFATLINQYDRHIYRLALNKPETKRMPRMCCRTVS